MEVAVEGPPASVLPLRAAERHFGDRLGRPGSRDIGAAGGYKHNRSDGPSSVRTWISLRPTLWVSQIGEVLAVGWVIASPLRGMRETNRTENTQDPQPQRRRQCFEMFLAELALVPAGTVDTTRLGLRLSPVDMAAFQARLRHLLDDFADRPDDPSAPAWSLFIALHPDPNRPRPAHNHLASE